MAQSFASTVVLFPRTNDPVLEALAQAPIDDLAESEEERLAVATAKASRRLEPHAVVENALEAWPAAE